MSNGVGRRCGEGESGSPVNHVIHESCSPGSPGQHNRCMLNESDALKCAWDSKKLSQCRPFFAKCFTVLQPSRREDAFMFDTRGGKKIENAAQQSNPALMRQPSPEHRRSR